MIEDKKYPVGLIDADSAPHVLASDALLDMRNMRIASGKSKDIGFFKSIKGNVVMTNSGNIPEGSVSLNGCFDPTGTYIIWLTKNVDPNKDQINYYNVVTNEYWLVIRSDMDEIGKVFGGLNFTKFVHSMRIVNDTLYWTDNNEEPRKIHIGAAIRATHPMFPNTPLYPGWQYSWINPPYVFVDKSALTTICKPPAYPPFLMKEYDEDFGSNYISNESFQFATQYEYYSGERSTLSCFSEPSMINQKGEKKNVINVFLKQDDIPIPSPVRKIRLLVKIFSTGKMFVVKTWDKEVDAESDQIADFSSGGALSFRFFYNYLGEAIDSNTASKPFESVPRLAEAQEIIKNRLMYANTLEGYDTPTQRSSIQFKIDNGVAIDSIGVIRHGVRGRLMWGGGSYIYSGWFVYLSVDDAEEITESGYYLITSTESTTGDFIELPVAIDAGDIDFKGATLEDVWVEITGTDPSNINTTTPGFQSFSVSQKKTRFIPTEEEDNIAIRSLLHNTEFHGGTVFFDKYLRKCGVVLPYNYADDAVLPGEYGGRVYLPVRDNQITAYYPEILWKLSNDNALGEIPDWAVYYAPVLKARDRIGYFVSSFCADLCYVKRDEENNYDYSDTSYSITDTVAIGIDTTSLVHAGLGYTYSEGDMCVLVNKDEEKHELPIIGQDGKYILVSPKNIGGVVAEDWIYEIFTPIRSDNEQFFYEIGQLYKITDPGSSVRAYSVTEGAIAADTYFIYRTFDTDEYYAQTMSPNDEYYMRWVSMFGRANVVTNTGEQRKLTNISFSNTFIPGSSVNGLSSFEALNEENLSPEFGPIRKIISTSKVTGTGNVLLAICENATASIYVEEAEVSDQNGTVQLVKSEKVIGQINTLRGGYGTRHPESVAESNGNVFWWDKNRAGFIKYSSNGLYPISDNKLKGVSYDLSLKTGDGELVIGGIDVYNDEYLVQPVFDDEMSDDFRMKMPGKRTIVICISENKSRGIDEYYSEGIVCNGRDTYMFKDGHLWKQEAADSHSLFFGTPVVPSLSMASNAGGTDIKIFESIDIKSNEAPDIIYLRTLDPNFQESDLVASDLKVREGVFYAAMLRDYHSPNTPGDAFYKRIRGDKMRGAYLMFKINFPTGKEIRLKDININYNISAGHVGK